MFHVSERFHRSSSVIRHLFGPDLNTLAFRTYSQKRPPPPPPKLAALTTPDSTNEARAWLSTFKERKIPRELVELQFSRSSGPGGQHVNKTNSKATLRCPVDALWIPLWARPELQKNPHYVSSSNSLLINSSASRSQAENVEACLSKLHDIVLVASSASIHNEPSEEQKKRVAALEKAERARRRQVKSYRSDIKSSRSKGSWD